MIKKKYTIAVALLLLLGIGILIPRLLPQAESMSEVAKTDGTYIALGDSVAAGVGLQDYSDSSACNRTNQAYPNVIAKKLQYSLKNVACSGATTQQGLLDSQNVNNLAISPQIDTLSSEAKPNLISMTIGVNDTNWTTLIQKCYTGTCGTATDTNIVNTGITAATQNLTTALTRIKSTYPDDAPKVVMTSYYSLFSSTPKSTCTELRGVDTTEQAWIAQLQDSVNASIKSVAAQYDFVRFVPIDFAGHELCSDDSWIQNLSAKAPYHPTEAGQTAIANQILTAVKIIGGAQ